MKFLPLFWPAVIILSTLVAGLVNFVAPNIAGRPIVVMWFLLTCPGMVLVRFFQLEDLVAQWTLALALSLSLDALVAGVQMYTGRWSPSGTLEILMGFCFVGTIVHITQLKIQAGAVV